MQVRCNPNSTVDNCWANYAIHGENLISTSDWGDMFTGEYFHQLLGIVPAIN